MTNKEIVEKLSKVNKDFTVDIDSISAEYFIEIESIETNCFGIIFKLAYNGKIRTAKQVIEELSKYDQNLDVVVDCNYETNVFYEVVDIEIWKNSVVLETY